MGTSGSKATRTAAGAAARKYPTRSPTQPSPTSHPTPVATNSTSFPTSSLVGSRTLAQERRQGPKVHSQAQPSEARTEAIDLDARDPDLAGRLSELGPVRPYPTFSPSSTSSPEASSSNTFPNQPSSPFGSGRYPTPATNPAIAILTARSRIQEAVEQEKIDAGRSGFKGRQFLDIATLRKVLALRDEQGMKEEDIERALNLRKGTVRGLGKMGVVEAA